MKQPKPNLKNEYQATFAYYKKTVRNHVRDAQLGGAQYDMAFLAWDRLIKARHSWDKSLNEDEQARARATEPNLEELAPRRLESDDTIVPEVLATLAASRLGQRKPQSVRSAVEEAHKILIEARNYLKELPERKDRSALTLEAQFSRTVSFEEILSRVGVPMLPPVQAGRNKGAITKQALKKALKDYASAQSKGLKQAIQQAIENREISCKLLEEIRWQRFRRHVRK